MRLQGYKCDYCGKIVNATDEYIFPAMSITIPNYSPVLGYDLCSECADRVKGVLKSMLEKKD